MKSNSKRESITPVNYQNSLVPTTYWIGIKSSRYGTKWTLLRTETIGMFRNICVIPVIPKWKKKRPPKWSQLQPNVRIIVMWTSRYWYNSKPLFLLVQRIGIFVNGHWMSFSTICNLWTFTSRYSFVHFNEYIRYRFTCYPMMLVLHLLADKFNCV